MRHVLNRQILKIIREFIEETGLSISDIARESGLSKAWISKLNNNRESNMSIETAASLLEVAGYELVIRKTQNGEEKVSRLKKNSIGNGSDE